MMTNEIKQKIFNHLTQQFRCDCGANFDFRICRILKEDDKSLLLAYDCPKCFRYYRATVDSLILKETNGLSYTQSDNLVVPFLPIYHNDLTEKDPASFIRSGGPISSDDVLEAREYLSTLDIHRIKALIPKVIPNDHQI